jgi:hypothetical protein
MSKNSSKTHFESKEVTDFLIDKKVKTAALHQTGTGHVPILIYMFWMHPKRNDSFFPLGIIMQDVKYYKVKMDQAHSMRWPHRNNLAVSRPT